VELALGEEKALGALEDFLAAGDALGTAFDARHVRSPLRTKIEK
jgi:hypothetical protein